MDKTRKTHKVYHTTNPYSLPNPYNWEPRIRLLDQEGNFIEMISQIAAFRLMKGDAAELVLVKEPTVKLKIPANEWKLFAEGAPKDNRRLLKFLHARRTILYGNYHVLGLDGSLMFHCNNQKILWYLNRDLVDIVGYDPPTFKLKFAPGGPGHIGDNYYITPKLNHCVCCGVTTGLNRHHVVPSFYRRYMGLKVKSHSYHDVLLLCLACHEKYEDEAGKLKLIIAKEYKFPVHGFWHRDSGELFKDDKNALSAYKAAIALAGFGNRIPPARRQYLEERIAEMLGHKPSEAEIQEMVAVKVAPKYRPKMIAYIDHGEMVVRQLDSMEKLQKFTERWRQHFLLTMKPQNLPANWDLLKPILPEDFEPMGDEVCLLHDRTKDNWPWRSARLDLEGPPMGMMKRMLEEYVEAVHPDDYDAQDKLFDEICQGLVEVPPLKEMQAIIAGYKHSPQDAGWS